MTEIFGTLAGVLVFIGYLLNVRKHKGCWPIWIGSAILWVVYGILLGAVALIIQNVIFMPIFIWGWKTWYKNNKV